jgi:hypothetical protein
VNVDLLWDDVFSSKPLSVVGGAPNFSPTGGIGTIWTDTSGKKWQYTAQGWKKL